MYVPYCKEVLLTSPRQLYCQCHPTTLELFYSQDCQGALPLCQLHKNWSMMFSKIYSIIIWAVCMVVCTIYSIQNMHWIHTLNIIQYILHSLHLLKGANKIQTLYTSYTISLVKNGHGTLNCSGFSSDWISYSNCRGDSSNSAVQQWEMKRHCYPSYD